MSAGAIEVILPGIPPMPADVVEQIALNHPAICRYFLRGNCRFGTFCRFSHDLSGIETVITADAEAATKELAEEDDGDVKPSTSRKNWANAPVFVPQHMLQQLADDIDDEDDVAGAAALDPQRTWAQVVGGDDCIDEMSAEMQCMSLGAKLALPMGPLAHLADQLCPYMSPCPYMHNCTFGMHMQLCEMCDQYCLHPTDTQQRRKHNQECLAQHEKDMELSFAIARSKDKTCGICFETIIEKSGREKRFGILPNCNHIFCLECIRKWRQATQFENKIIRSCPECRVASDFVCPSAFWVDTKEDKEKLLSDYRSALGDKDCKYFKKGEGTCPFANKCFYKHALPNGDIVDVGNPKRPRVARRSSNELVDLIDIYLWEFVAQRGDFNFIDILSNASDETEDSDWYDDDEM